MQRYLLVLCLACFLGGCVFSNIDSAPPSQSDDDDVGVEDDLGSGNNGGGNNGSNDGGSNNGGGEDAGNGNNDTTVDGGAGEEVCQNFVDDDDDGAIDEDCYRLAWTAGKWTDSVEVDSYMGAPENETFAIDACEGGAFAGYEMVEFVDYSSGDMGYATMASLYTLQGLCQDFELEVGPSGIDLLPAQSQPLPRRQTGNNSGDLQSEVAVCQPGEVVQSLFIADGGYYGIRELGFRCVSLKFDTSLDVQLQDGTRPCATPSTQQSCSAALQASCPEDTVVRAVEILEGECQGFCGFRLRCARPIIEVVD